MTRRSLQAAVACLLGLLLWTSAAGADVIHLRNGDRIVGEIIRETGQGYYVRIHRRGNVWLSREEVDWVDRETRVRFGDEGPDEDGDRPDENAEDGESTTPDEDEEPTGNDAADGTDAEPTNGEASDEGEGQEGQEGQEGEEGGDETTDEEDEDTDGGGEATSVDSAGIQTVVRTNLDAYLNPNLEGEHRLARRTLQDEAFQEMTLGLAADRLEELEGQGDEEYVTWARRQILELVGGIDRPASAEIILDALDATSPEVHLAAIDQARRRAISEAAPRIGELLRQDRILPDEIPEVVRAYARCAGVDGANLLLDYMSSREEEIVEAAGEALDRVLQEEEGPPALPVIRALADLTEDRSEIVRRTAARCLARNPSMELRAARAAMSLAESPDPVLREASARALAWLAGKTEEDRYTALEARDLLVELLESDRVVEVRQAAIRSAHRERLEDREVGTALVGALRDRDGGVRRSAHRALQAISGLDHEIDDRRAWADWARSLR